MQTADVVIAGAGIIGLSIALELARAGLGVTVLERGEAMREASWAAAGMLAASDPENPRELREFSEFSLGLYPGFLAEVERLSERRVRLRTSLTLQALGRHTGCAPGQALALHGAGEVSGAWAGLANAAGGSVEAGGGMLTDAELARLAPGLVAGGRRFMALDEQSLDPRDLCEALPVGARTAGVVVREHTAVRALAQDGAGWRVETDAGEWVRAGQYVHCCGAWSGQALDGTSGAGVDDEGMDGSMWGGRRDRAEAAGLPVEPRKGQMLVVTMPEQGPQLGCVVRTPELYLVPRRDGRIVVGATVEDAGFDRAIREEARDGLLRAAGELWPPILEGRVTDGWTGLRPSTPDSLPLVGALDLDEAEDDGCSIRGAGGDLGANHDADQGGDLSLAQSGMLGPRGRRGMGRRWIATGHFRNGILLAPGTARVVRQLILGERPEVDLVPFRAGRFVPAVTGAASGS